MIGGNFNRRFDTEGHYRFGVNNGWPSPGKQHAEDTGSRAGSRADGSTSAPVCRSTNRSAQGRRTGNRAHIASNRGGSVAVNHLRLNGQRLTVGQSQIR